LVLDMSLTHQFFRRCSALAAALVLFCLAATATAAPIPAGNTGWSWSNPLPQGNSLVRVSAAGGRVWVGGSTGTLLRSDDRGRSFSAVRTGLLAEVRTVVAISAESVIFGGTCALRRSDDGGVTVRRLAWSASDDNCAAGIQAVSFPSSVTGFLLLTSGDIYATTDGGENWKKRGMAPIADGTGTVNDMIFQTPQRGVLSIGGRILQSVDGGVHWQEVAAGTLGSTALSFAFSSVDAGFAAGNRGDLLRTLDGGASWVPVVADPGLTQSPALSDMACSGFDTCVASGVGGAGLLRTADGGKSWQASTVPGGTPADITITDGGAAVVVGAGGLIAISEDAGASWTRLDAQVAGRFSGLSADSRRSAVAYGAEGAIARTTDAGSSWQALSSAGSEPLVDAMASGRRVLALSQSGNLYASGDGGVTWKRVGTGLDAAPSGLLLLKGGSSVLIGPRGVFVARRWGKRPRRASGPAGGMTLRAGDLAGGAAFVYGPHRIAVTTDRGRSWQRLRAPRRSARIVDLEMIDRKNGFLLDSAAEVFVTKDGGERWLRLETTGANTAASLAFGDRKHGYITDATGRVLATADGGKTWSRQYPYFDSTAAAPLLVTGLSRSGALTLVSGTNRIFATSTAGGVGRPSVLTISTSAKRVRRGSVVPVNGTLTPATGIERISVLARVTGAKGGTQWTSQNVTVSPEGTFTTRWKITADTEFIARWSGDFAHDGDGAPLKVVRLRR
jgi:photosystem II stability/assembly factor-like uncharacterized protein